MVNVKYGKNTSGTTIKYAPCVFKENGSIIVPRANDDEAYHSRGWFTIVDVKPEYDPATKMLSLVGWTRDDQLMTLIAQYDIVDLPTPPTQQVRRFSKLKVTLFCVEAGVWENVKAFLTGLGYYDLFVMAQFFLESDEYFKKGLSMFKQQYIEEGHPEEETETMIQQMLEYAFDGYEYVEQKNNNNI